MCLIPGGSFWMGCNKSVDTGCAGDEKPYHQVTLSPYYIDRTEVTQGKYRECVVAGECVEPSCNWDPTVSPNLPVVCLDWDKASLYCAWAGKRLPTEAEWEKAARGTDGRKYPWGNEEATCDHAVMSDCPDDAQDVCGKSPMGDSPYGLCDMSGNAGEFVSDWYDSGYYQDSSEVNPDGPVSGSNRVIRGGNYSSTTSSLRASSRYGKGSPVSGWYTLGFRCARSQ